LEEKNVGVEQDESWNELTALKLLKVGGVASLAHTRAVVLGSIHARMNLKPKQ
jgi:hypothetical protein